MTDAPRRRARSSWWGAGLLLSAGLLTATDAARGDTLMSPEERAADQRIAHMDPARRFEGERIEWSVQYGALDAGTATMAVDRAPDGALLLEGHAVSAPWYRNLFQIDDQVWSESVPGQGSRRYRTRFREGGFSQDQDMAIAADAVSVLRRQLIDGAWKEWTTPYPGAPGAEDPASAMQRLRLLEDRDQGQTPVGRGWSYDVFSGAETWTIAVTLVTREVIDTELLGPVPTRVLALHTRHEGMLEQKGRFRLWLTDDARRIPVKMEVRTNFGTIRGALTTYEPPPSWSVAAAASD
ncbi:MAG: DUF3108 domain-containing protein [Alphaproteobacteria bacterium]|nr:DUF3108 domain-containing protein [Alphaproteobacteria bacterium]